MTRRGGPGAAKHAFCLFTPPPRSQDELNQREIAVAQYLSLILRPDAPNRV
jgi:hypothetical protein